MPKKSTLSRQQLQHDARTYIWHPFTQMQEWEQQAPLLITRGKGARLYDIDGNAYLDGTSSIWVNLHGHRHPTIDLAIRNQLKNIAHTTLLGLSHPPAIHLAKALVRLAPKGLHKVFFSDNGSTAVEIALKMAIQYWQQCPNPQPRKTQFVHLGLAYHGDTVGGMSLSGIELFQKPFSSLLFPGRHQIEAPYCYRCPVDLQFPQCQLACSEPLETLLQKKHEEIAGVLVEPMVQGVAGLLPSPPGYLRRLQELCRKYQVLLIADEVATGFGRTGRMFACEHESVSPDIMAIAKGMTGGYLPLAATLATDEIYSAFLGGPHEGKTFFHGHSYTGNPLGCAAALANLSIFKTERTLSKVQRRTPKLSSFLNTLADDPWVGDIRQCGYMVGIELVQRQHTKDPFPVLHRIGHRVTLAARALGLLIRPIGNTIILMPPLSSTLEELKQMVDIIKVAIGVVRASISSEHMSTQ
ncbi:MAG: adenosylmethionine--8-amino-7-oxononanoate transaminase [Nitrospirota bacterium]|nr:adenosylmethionine--8-amino-7-oxononanoate transaminase [Nitrospinota bacterium]MDH5586966.1 adenosylmethionine--8-amino-7-oxononanoate transaminase [Nitrospirota bacterium]MDH5775031.1 adenosylmethionine--8-amino-7-oxononanoate transaminase [Nitrospirota bacterium]